MPTGVMINCLAVLSGGLIGGFLGNRIPKRLKDSLTLTFGISAISIGIIALIGVNALSPVILSLILGMTAGELLNLERRVFLLGRFAVYHLPIPNKISDDKSMELFVTVVVLFCASGTGIFGTLTEGFSGDSSILISKSIMDFFTAIVFATTMGHIIGGIAIPQFLIFMTLYFCARLIMPHLDENMIADFKACGGIITFAVGLRVCEIQKVRVMNMIPALILVLPISRLWSQLLG